MKIDLERGYQSRREALEKKDADRASQLSDRIAIDLEMYRRVSLSRAALELEAREGTKVKLVGMARHPEAVKVSLREKLTK